MLICPVSSLYTGISLHLSVSVYMPNPPCVHSLSICLNILFILYLILSLSCLNSPYRYTFFKCTVSQPRETQHVSICVHTQRTQWCHKLAWSWQTDSFQILSPCFNGCVLPRVSMSVTPVFLAHTHKHTWISVQDVGGDWGVVIGCGYCVWFEHHLDNTRR